MCNYTYFEFDKKISIFELISLIVTTGFGVYIVVKIGRVLNLQNSEKTLLIEEVKESIKIIERIDNAINRRIYNLKSIAGELKALNEHLYLLEKLFESSHCKTISLSDLRFDLRTLRSTITGWPVSNNMVTLDSSSYTPSKSACRILRHRYSKLVFEINSK